MWRCKDCSQPMSKPNQSRRGETICCTVNYMSYLTWMHLWSLSSSGMTSSSSSMSSEPLLNQVNLWPRSKSDAPTQKEPVRLNAFRMLTTFRFCAAVGSSASCPCRFRHSYCACGQGSASSLIRNLWCVQSQSQTVVQIHIKSKCPRCPL